MIKDFTKIKKLTLRFIPLHVRAWGSLYNVRICTAHPSGFASLASETIYETIYIPQKIFNYLRGHHD